MTTPKPLSAEELAGYLFDYNKGEVDLTSVWHARLLATITQAHADLAREKERGDALRAALELDYLQHDLGFGQWVCKRCGQHDRDRDDIPHIETCVLAYRYTAALDHAADIVSLRSQLAEAIKAQRTPGTVEICENYNSSGYCTQMHAGANGSCPRLNCPIKVARTQEGSAS